MTISSSFDAFGNGVSEKLYLLVNRAPAILLGTAVCAGIGYLAAGTATALLAAKVSCLIFSIVATFVYRVDYECYSRSCPLSDKVFQLLGNLTPLGALYLLLFRIPKLAGL